MASLNALARLAAASAGRAPTPSSLRIVATAPARRFLSTEAAAGESPKPPPPPTPPAKKGGSSFLQRLGAFLTGAGLGSGVGYYYLAQEIKGSTEALEKAIVKNHRDLSDRLAALENEK